MHNNEKVSIDINISHLDDIIRFITSANSLVTNRGLLKARKFIEIIDDEKYENDREMEIRLYLIKKYLEGYFDKHIERFDLLIEYTKGEGQYKNEIEEIITEVESIEDLSNEEVMYIDSFMSSILKYSFIFSKQEKLDKLSIDLKSHNYNSLDEFCKAYEETVKVLYKDFNDVKVIEEDSMMDFASDSDSLDDMIGYTHNLISRPNHKLKTSVQLLNKMLNGGFEGGRFYLILGFQGGLIFGSL